MICINCGQCINRCPTGALRANDPTDDVWAAIDDPTKHVVMQTAPSPRAGIGECFGLEPGHALTFELNTALRRCGFDSFASQHVLNPDDVEAALNRYGNVYQNATDDAVPIWKLRHG